MKRKENSAQIKKSGNCYPIKAAAVPLISALALSFSLAPESFAYEVKLKSDSSISLSRIGAIGDDISFPYEKTSDGGKVHVISIDQPISYHGCRINYRKSIPVRVRWTPPADFSKFAAPYYDIILTIMEPSLSNSGRSPRIDEIKTPSGYSATQLDDYEKRKSGDVDASVSSFFQTAFLAQHFRHVLPDGHGRTARMTNASVDHLYEANQGLWNINIQPGYEFERFVEDNAGSGMRASKSISSLQGINVAFFRDIRAATRHINSGNGEDCKVGLTILTELSECHDEIAASNPDLLLEVARVANSNSGQSSVQGVFDFRKRIQDSLKVCEEISG